MRARQRLKRGEVEERPVEHVPGVCDGRSAVKHSRAERHGGGEERRLVRERRGGQAAAHGEGAQGEHVEGVSHRHPGEPSAGWIARRVREHSVPAPDVVVLGHVRERHEVGHLPEVERGREDAARGLDRALARGGPSHQRGHRADDGARPRVEPVHPLHRGVAQRVERDVTGAQGRRGVVGLLLEKPDARHAGDDAEERGVRHRAPPRRQRPSHRPRHHRVVLDLEDLIPRVRRRRTEHRAQRRPPELLPVDHLTAAQHVTRRRGRHDERAELELGEVVVHAQRRQYLGDRAPSPVSRGRGGARGCRRARGADSLGGDAGGRGAEAHPRARGGGGVTRGRRGPAPPRRPLPNVGAAHRRRDEESPGVGAGDRVATG